MVIIGEYDVAYCWPSDCLMSAAMEADRLTSRKTCGFVWNNTTFAVVGYRLIDRPRLDGRRIDCHAFNVTSDTTGRQVCGNSPQWQYVQVKSSRPDCPRGRNFVLGLGLGLDMLSSASSSSSGIWPRHVLRLCNLALSICVFHDKAQANDLHSTIRPCHPSTNLLFTAI